MGMRKTPSDISCFLYAPVECRLVRTKAKTAPAPKPYRIGHLFTDENSDFDAVSVMLRSCAAPRRSDLVSGSSHISEGSGPLNRCSYTRGSSKNLLGLAPKMLFFLYKIRQP